MKLFVNTQRKDGRFACSYCYSNGVRLNKVRTLQQIADEQQKGYVICANDWSLALKINSSLQS